MPNPVVHFELNGSDAKALADFYARTFGWNIDDFPMPNGSYMLIDTKAGGINGGIAQAPAGAPPMTTCYVGVADPQATLDAVERLGGATVVPVTDAGMVVFALFRDPQGNHVGVVKADPSQQAPHEHREPGEGAVVWFEIAGPDGPKLREFYTQVFGWAFEVMPGDGFDYGTAHAGAGGVGIGVGQAPAGSEHATFYIQTADIAGKLRQIEAAGGTTVVPETDMGMVAFGLFTDPQGCLVGLVRGGQQGG